MLNRKILNTIPSLRLVLNEDKVSMRIGNILGLTPGQVENQRAKEPDQTPLKESYGSS